ncbi:hypothetical protein I4U23_004112 [Adineta vaga]|nr:hypothetical protein I4U23_004112 [Adineta vaga]
MVIVKKKLKREPHQTQADNGITIVWLDIKNSDYLNREASLHLISNYLKLFNNIDSCIDYLLSLEIDNSKQKIFLILSGTQGKTILPLVYEQLHIIHIYIFCSHKEKHEKWINKYLNKIKGIFIDKNELITALNDDILFYTKTISMSIFSPITSVRNEISIRNLNKQHALFMWYQLLIETLKRMPLTLVSRNELLAECRVEYSNNQIELCKIQEFADTYNSDNVIGWYTRDSFLYRLLNRALRSQDIRIIYNFRFVLVDLHNCLTQLHSKHIHSLKTKPETSSVLTVYRGQGLPVEELQNLKDNIDGRIAMNSFLSASLSSDIALGFTGNGTGRPMVESVLFEINCPTKEYSSKPFANIQNYSHLKTENEILFTLGTVFQIDSVEILTDEIWHVKLTLYDEDDDMDRNELIDNLKSDIKDTSEVSTLAKLLIEINEIDKAEYFYHLILKDLPLNHCDRIAVQNNIGAIHASKGDYKTALKCYKQSFKLSQTLLPYDFVTVSMILNNIGYVYNELGNYIQSIKYHRKAFRIQKKVFPLNDIEYATTFNHLGKALSRSSFTTNKELLARIYFNLGVLYENKCNIGMTIKYYKIAINLELACQEYNTSPSLAITYISLGQVYLEENDLENASIQFEKALKIAENCLIFDDNPIQLVLSNIVEVYKRKNDYTNALNYTNKLLDIQLKNTTIPSDELATTYFDIGYINDCKKDCKQAERNYQIALNNASSTHSNLGQLYYYLACIYNDRQDFDIALVNYENALKYFSDKDDYLANIHNNIGFIYRCKHDYTKALDSYYQALKINMNDMNLTSTIYYNIAVIYDDRKDYNLALYYYQIALDVIRKSKEMDDNLYIKIYNNMAGIYQNTFNYHKGLNCIEKALELQLNSDILSTDYETIATTYSNLGTIYFRLFNYSLASENYKKALEISSKFLHKTHPHIAEYRDHVAVVKRHLKYYKI